MYHGIYLDNRRTQVHLWVRVLEYNWPVFLAFVKK